MTAPWLARMSGQTSSPSFEKLFSSTSKLDFDPLSPLDHHSPSPSHAAVGVGRLLFPIFALALALPEDFFDDKVKH